ncbi:MAG: glucose-6-phosphate isomerase [Deltaproteobacteria bacterium]|nr:glucose-6-phosphate isomerase [Deltaproteobacteria bacterium]
MSKKRFGDANWVASQAVTLDFNFAMSEFVGEHGLTEKEMEELLPRLAAIDQDLNEGRQSGRLGFMTLPFEEHMVNDIRRVAKPILEWCWDFVVLGIGGSALGARALHQALCHPQHNFFTMARRQHRPALWLLDNIDPDYFYGMLDGLDLRRTAFNVISKSGGTAETLAQFLFIYQLLSGRMGQERAAERIVITTDPEKGPLRRLVSQEGFPSLNVPTNVGGRFSVLSPVGLLPAFMAGIDVEELLAGARFMAVRLREEDHRRNPAYRLASLFYLFATRRRRNILVIMPYASLLGGMGDWFSQLWAESLGKKFDLEGRVVNVGTTPVKAVGVTDQHSQLQLYMEGPHDKLITFLEVGKFQHRVDLPALYPHLEELSYLGGRTMNELLQVERQATAFNLMKAGRPSLTLRLPEINPFTVGQLIYLLEVTTVAAAGLFGVNPLDQPGVEGGKQTTYGLMGRPGFERHRQELDQAPKPLEKYLV